MVKNAIILSWDRPTWKLHLWHYFGSLKNRIDLQNKLDSWDKMYILIADMQALTDRKNKESREAIKENIFELMKDYLLLWLTPEKINFVLQSNVPEISSIYQIFSSFTTMNYIENNIPAVREEARLKWNTDISVWFYTHPLHQAADILSISEEWKKIFVPVWKDQAWNLQYSKHISRKINNIAQKYCWNDIVSLPVELFWVEQNILWLDWKKMSKSLWNAIFIRDSKEDIKNKIMKKLKIWYNYNTKQPTNINLFNSYADLFFSKKEAEQIKKDYLEFNKLHIKTYKENLINNIWKFLEKIKINKEIGTLNDKDFKTLAKNILLTWTEKYKSVASDNYKKLVKLFFIDLEL